jgi:hypothetical protein
MNQQELKYIKCICRILRASRTVSNREAVLRLGKASPLSSEEYHQYHKFLSDNCCDEESMDEAINAIELELM